MDSITYKCCFLRKAIYAVCILTVSLIYLFSVSRFCINLELKSCSTVFNYNTLILSNNSSFYNFNVVEISVGSFLILLLQAIIFYNYTICFYFSITIFFTFFNSYYNSVIRLIAEIFAEERTFSFYYLLFLFSYIYVMKPYDNFLSFSLLA